VSGPSGTTWERRAWLAGVVFVVALLAEAVISTGIPVNQDDSAAKIARELDAHSDLILIAAYLSVVYAIAFLIYLWKLHGALRAAAEPPSALATLVLVGGVLLVALHGVSDIGIYGLLGGKLAWIAALAGSLLFLQGFGLGGVINTFGLIVDLIGFVLFLFFVLASSIVMLRRGEPAGAARAG
jgi:hypothetical protein